MGTDEIVEEKEKRDEVVGGIERSEPLFSFVPGFELLVKAFDQIVGNVVAETLNPDMSDAQDGFHRDFVGAVTVGDNGPGLAEMLDGIQ